MLLVNACSNISENHFPKTQMRRILKKYIAAACIHLEEALGKVFSYFSQAVWRTHHLQLSQVW